MGCVSSQNEPVSNSGIKPVKKSTNHGSSSGGDSGWGIFSSHSSAMNTTSWDTCSYDSGGSCDSGGGGSSSCE